MTKKVKNPKKSPHARPDAQRDLGNNIDLKARFWLEKNGETYLASGRIELLEKLEELGSISSAAEAMGISYHHAWTLIDKMNNLSDEPLIITSQGGKGGGGTELTTKGKALIQKFYYIQDRFHELVDDINI